MVIMEEEEKRMKKEWTEGSISVNVYLISLRCLLMVCLIFSKGAAAGGGRPPFKTYPTPSKDILKIFV